MSEENYKEFQLKVNGKLYAQIILRNEDVLKSNLMIDIQRVREAIKTFEEKAMNAKDGIESRYAFEQLKKELGLEEERVSPGIPLPKEEGRCACGDGLLRDSEYESGVCRKCR